MNLNKVFVLGRVTRDPELKALPSGDSVANLSIATNKKWKDKNGDTQEIVEFHNVIAFGKNADNISAYSKKGNLLLVEGRLQTRSWEDKETGKKLYRTEIIVDTFQLPPKSLSGGEGESSDYQRPAHQKPRTQADDDFDNYGKPEKDRKKTGKKSSAKDEVEFPEEEINPEDIPF